MKQLKINISIFLSVTLLSIPIYNSTISAQGLETENQKLSPNIKTTIKKSKIENSTTEKVIADKNQIEYFTETSNETNNVSIESPLTESLSTKITNYQHIDSAQLTNQTINQNIEHITTEMPTTEQVTTEIPTIEKSTTEISTVEQVEIGDSYNIDQSIEIPTIETPITEKITIEQPITEQPTIKQPKNYTGPITVHKIVSSQGIPKDNLQNKNLSSKESQNKNPQNKNSTLDDRKNNYLLLPNASQGAQSSIALIVLALVSRGLYIISKK